MALNDGFCYETMMPKQNIYIIGFPLSHTLSPAMHNAAFQHLQLPYIYQAKTVAPKNLEKFVKQVRKNKHCRGFNVTIPHKESIIKYLDYISSEALRMGAVNTILKINQFLLGFNTDAQGYLQSLSEQTKFNPLNKKIILLGAGGAAKAIGHALAHEGAKEMIIINRSKHRAKTLQKNLQKFYPKCLVTASDWHPSNLKKNFPKTDLVINCTSVGLHGTAFTNFPFHLLAKKTLISDIVYKPRMTPWLKDAKKMGFKIHTGEGMLLHQGALAFTIWTGIAAPVVVMKKAVINIKGCHVIAKARLAMTI